VIAFFGALAGARSLNDFAVETYGDGGPAVLHVSGERDYEQLSARVHRDDYVLLPSTGEFGAALAQADAAVVLDVYPSRERAEDFPDVSGLCIAEAAADAARGRPVAWAPGFDEAQRVLERLLRAGDMCLVMGAGDVDELGRRLVEGG